MKKTLEALGSKLDAAKLDEQVDVGTEVDHIEDLIWRFNDALESAGEAWLRDNLGAGQFELWFKAINSRLPYLPFYVDDAQSARALDLGIRISDRLGQHDVVMNRVVYGLEKTERGAEIAGYVTAGGFVLMPLKKHAYRQVLKRAIILGGALAADYAAEKGLRTAGASEHTIKGGSLGGHFSHAHPY